MYIYLCHLLAMFFCIQEAHLETLEKMRKESGNEDFDLDDSRTPFQLQIEARVQALDIADV